MADTPHGDSKGHELLQVAFIGDAFVDVQISGVATLPSWGTDTACSSCEMLPGGSCASAARQLGSLGRSFLSAHFFSAIGDDECGRFFAQRLEEEGCTAAPRETLRVLAGCSQSTCVILSGASDRAMVSCYASNHRVDIGVLRDAPRPWALLHIGGYFSCVGLHTDECIERVVQLKRQGTLISLDPQFDCDGAWTGRGGHLKRLLPLLDVFLPNEVEACGVSGAATPAAALDVLAAAHPSLLIVLKCGAEGVIAARGAERWHAPALEGVAFVDATGAGDAADAGFLLAYLREPTDVPAALKSANAAGALAVGVMGGCARPIALEQHERMLTRAPPQG